MMIGVAQSEYAENLVKWHFYHQYLFAVRYWLWPITLHCDSNRIIC